MHILSLVIFFRLTLPTGQVIEDSTQMPLGDSVLLVGEDIECLLLTHPSEAEAKMRCGDVKLTAKCDGNPVAADWNGTLVQFACRPAGESASS